MQQGGHFGIMNMSGANNSVISLVSMPGYVSRNSYLRFSSSCNQFCQDPFDAAFSRPDDNSAVGSTNLLVHFICDAILASLPRPPDI